MMNYNNAGELEKIQIQDVGEISFEYFANGNIGFIHIPGGQGVSHRWFHYDEADRTDFVQNITASGIQLINYSHDNNGNITQIDGVPTYQYDSLNRLVWWYNTANGVTTEYSYDKVGNLTEVKENGTVVKALSYDCGNKISNSGFTYDQSGNMTSDGEKDYLYDPFNRLTEVKDHSTGQSVGVYTYDFAGRRTSKTTGGSTTYDHWDKDSNLLAETDSSGVVKATYTYDDKGNPLAMRRAGESYYYLTNSHGDIVSLTDSQGQIVNTYTYDPWGKPLTQNGTVENPIRYAGYFFDSETGLYYLMSRFYDPELGRFLTREGIDLSMMANPLGLNQYIYCVDNPVNLIDKDGEDPAKVQQARIRAARAIGRLFFPFLDEQTLDRCWTSNFVPHKVQKRKGPNAGVYGRKEFAQDATTFVSDALYYVDPEPFTRVAFYVASKGSSVWQEIDTRQKCRKGKMY